MYSECHIVKRAMLYLSLTIPQVVISTTPNFCFCQRLEPKEKLHRTTVRPSKLDVFIGQQRKIFNESIVKKCMMLKWISCSTSEGIARKCTHLLGGKRQHKLTIRWEYDVKDGLAICSEGQWRMACTNIENEFIQIGSRGKTREKWVEVVREKNDCQGFNRDSGT